MGNISISVVNRQALSDAVRELDAVGELEIRGPAALMAGAQVLLPEVVAAAPVQSGRLKRAIRVKQGRGKSAMEVKVGAFSNDAPHAHLVEQGHGGPKPAPAHPFMQPVADMMEGPVLDAILDELTRGL